MRTRRTKIKKWLAPGEKLEDIIEGKKFLNPQNVMNRHQQPVPPHPPVSRKHPHKIHGILVVTSERAIFFERRFGGRLRDDSDKLWRQLINVHLDEGFFSSKLKLEFFRYHDSIVYHNPHKPGETPIDPPWELTNLPKRRARNVYTALKCKERIWKEKRRVEQLEHNKTLGGKYLQMESPHPPETTGDDQL